jgi:hypothetical protein
MPASRSVVSMLLRELGDFSLHPQGRPCGRPPAAAVLGRLSEQGRTLLPVQLFASSVKESIQLILRIPLRYIEHFVPNQGI